VKKCKTFFFFIPPKKKMLALYFFLLNFVLRKNNKQTKNGSTQGSFIPTATLKWDASEPVSVFSWAKAFSTPDVLGQ